MKKTGKKLLAALLVLLMVVAMLPTYAFAAGAVSDYVSVSHEGGGIIPDITLKRDINVIVKLDGSEVANGTYEIYRAANRMTLSLNTPLICAYYIKDVSVEESFIGTTLTDPIFWGDAQNSDRTNYQCNLTPGLAKEVNFIIDLASRDTVAHGGEVLDPAQSTAPTCGTAGMNVYVCSRCGDVLRVEPIAALDHDWNNWQHVGEPVTAETAANSIHSRTCKRDASHTETGSCDFKADPAQHVEPTATTPGKDVYVCSGCGASYEVAIPATAKQHTVRYDANGGTGAPAAETAAEQDAYPLSTASPSYPDDAAVFVGWSETKYEILNKDSAAPAVISTIKLDGDKTVYAVWSLDENGNDVPDVNEEKFALTYDANGGDTASVPVDTTKYLTGNKAVLNTGTVPTHTDDGEKKVVFAGWTAEAVNEILSKDSAAPSYLKDVTFADKSVTVYAAWGYDENGDGKADVNEEKFDLTYDPNGGAGGPGLVTGLLAQKDYQLDATAPTHENVDGKAVVFAGWTAEKDSKIYAKGDALPATITKIDIAADTSVYAVYGYDEDGNGKPDVFDGYATLSYYANGGEGAPAAETKVLTDGKAQFTVSSAVPTRSEYKFLGWSTDKAATTAQYKAGDKLELSENGMELYAVWELNPLVKYTLSYNANGGEGAPKAQSVESRTGSGKLVVSGTVPTREGYIFCGWSRVTSGYAQYQPGDPIEIEKDVTLYALWVDKSTTPKTGDESNIALWAVLAALSVMGMGAVITLGKKRREN